MFCEAWESQLCDMAMLLREINDVFEGRRGASQLQAPQTRMCLVGTVWWKEPGSFPAKFGLFIRTTAGVLRPQELRVVFKHFPKKRPFQRKRGKYFEVRLHGGEKITSVVRLYFS